MGRIAVAVVVSSWAIPISILVNRVVPDPYMDEIFHIPQSQTYCRGNFASWDPMITTPPGLYYLSLAYAACLYPIMLLAKAAQTFSDICSTPVLRSTNAVMAVVCSILVYDLLRLIHPRLSERKATFYSIVIALYPLHWFFTFLYYTDVASLAAVLAMYIACLKRQYWLSAMLGAFATLFRQTNIIWVVFVAANGAISYAEAFYEKDSILRSNFNRQVEDSSIQTSGNMNFTARGVRRRRVQNSSGNLSTSKESDLPLKHSPGLYDEILEVALVVWSLKWKLAIAFSPFFMVLLAFGTFVIWNGSIVLGAKEAHTASAHFAQIMYFGVSSAAALSSVFFSSTQAANIYRSFTKNRILACFKIWMAFVLAFIAVHFFSIAHPYLLADNRHYSFYIWRKVIQAHWAMKYFLIPVYVCSWFFIISLLAKSQRRIWVLSYMIATSLVLVPAPLIEFRYYTLPFYLLILHSKIDKVRDWLFIGTTYSIVNIFTLIIFLFRPFHWDHEPGVQRFIW